MKTRANSCFDPAKYYYATFTTIENKKITIENEPATSFRVLVALVETGNADQENGNGLT